MKTISTARLVAVALSLLLVTLGSPFSVCLAQGTAFTYQGRLTSNGTNYTGNVEFQPTLWTVSSGGSVLAANSPSSVIVGVTNGLFVLPLDFGTNFSGADRWLEIGVRTAIGPFTTLTPRQQVTPTPYAITAVSAGNLSGTVSAAGLSGTYSSAVTFSNAANNFSGTFIGTGAGLTALDAGQLTTGQVAPTVLSNAWKTTGNSGTTPGTQFLGTTDNQPLEFRVNGDRTLRLEPTTTNSSHSGIVNVVGGSGANVVGPGVYGATIAGGGASNWFGVIFSNRVDADFSSVSGGRGNLIQANAHESTIDGGLQNLIQTNAYESTIGGGYQNLIQAAAVQSTISGGQNNTIRFGSTGAAIGGGYANTVWAEYGTIVGGYDNLINGENSTIGGGRFNTISNGFSTIGGGFGNTIQGGAYTYASTIGGGEGNTIHTNAYASTIGGGSQNTIQGSFLGGTGSYAVIPGGYSNIVSADYCFAAGHNAVAQTAGTFVWADNNGLTFDPFAMSGPQGVVNSFNVRSTGGFYIVTGQSGSTITAGVYIQGGGGSWATLSDRNTKTNFAAVNSRDLLERLAKIPIGTWNYKSQSPDIRHIGPMAQDFAAAFEVGEDETHITTVDADGVALAAIQGLNQKLDETRADLKRRDAENAEMKQELAELKKLVRSLADKLTAAAQ